MKQSLLPAFLISILLPITSTAREQAWKKHTIIAASPANGNINTAFAADWNKDGHMDVLTSLSGKIVLLAGPDWKQKTIVHRMNGGCIHSAPMDVDGDGDIDFCGSGGGTVFWLECPDDDPFAGAWQFRNIDSEIQGTHCLITGDVDADGKLDLIANSSRSGDQYSFPNSLTWQKIPGNVKRAAQWQRHVFAQGDAPGASHYTGFGDVNGDGRPDISCAAKGGEKFLGGEWFAWWEQPENPARPWKKHLLADKQVGATNIIPFDLNGDKKTDFAATRGHGTGVLWFKAPDFTMIEIDTEIEGPHSLAIDDIDNDGDPDITTCGHTKDGIATWYENDGKANFTRHLVGKDQGSYDTRLIDMDGDKDLDILIAGHFSQNVVWYENPTNR